MTQKKTNYFCFALAISICMTVLIQVFQLYSLPILGILELFMLVNVCMIAVNIFNRKVFESCWNADYYRKFVSFPTCAEYIFIFVFFFYLMH